MIQINRGEENVVVLTLTEKTTLSPVFYLFEFKNDQSGVSQYFLAEDISDFPERYNKFLITETSAPDNTIGEVELKLTGFYKYTIREQSSSSNLDPDLSGAIVEIGKLKVIDVATINHTYDSQTKINIVYNG